MMFEEYVENGVFDLKRLEEDLFNEEYENCALDYARSQNPDLDYENARMEWERSGLFEQVLKERLRDNGCREWDDEDLGSGFVWIRELDLLMGLKGDGSRPVVAECNRGGLEELEYASGFMIMGWFFAQTIAERTLV